MYNNKVQLCKIVINYHNYTGSQQTWTVPEYVKIIKIIIFFFFYYLIVIKSETGVKIVINYHNDTCGV